jgi:FAD:protein FMN transferase
LPHRAEIRSAMAKVGYQKVRLDKATRTVRFERAGVELDPGGIGKGYAVDRVVDVLKKNGIEMALVTAGGSSMYGLGAPPGEAAWKVKVRHPKNPHMNVGEVKLRNSSMSTSGTSEKFFVAGGRVYSHIFDPRTGYPAQGMLSVSVTAPKTIDSEAWTKPLFIHGRKWAQKNKPKEFQAFFCEDKPEIACAWLQ